MALIGDALRQAFMPKHEYESLREEDKAWIKLQRPVLVSILAAICFLILVCTIVSLKIVFPGDSGKRPFCSDRRLQPLQINMKGGGDSDLFPGAFYLTDQETVDYYWMVVFIPSLVIFLISAAYLCAGLTVAYSAPARHGCLTVVENNYCASKRGGVRCLSILNIVFAIIFGLLALFLGSSLLTLGSSCSLPLFWCYEISTWGMVILYGGTAYFLRRRAATVLDDGDFSGRNLGLEMLEANTLQVTPEVERRVSEGFRAWMGGLEQFTATDGYDYSGGSNVLKVLGYFSMVGLLRVHCLLGDYHTGLKCLLPIDISQQGVYTSVIGSHITTIYHYGFANLMLRRYVDAIHEFNKILLYIYKTKQYHQQSPQYEQILKKNEQMYALLAICLSLCPQIKLVEETVNSQLREKYGEKMIRMQRYDDEAFAMYDELFSYACPKFITPSAPSFEEPLVNYNQDAYRLQLKLFLYEVKQQQLLSGVRTFLKVYSTITLAKLANYMEVDETTLRTILMTYKHKTHAVDSEGKIISNADVDFYIDDDMIHVVESKPVKRYGDYFLRQIVKLEGVINDMDRIKLE